VLFFASFLRRRRDPVARPPRVSASSFSLEYDDLPRARSGSLACDRAVGSSLAREPGECFGA